MSKVSFNNKNAENFVPIVNKDQLHNQLFKLVATNNQFAALALLSEGYVNKTYAGPEKAANKTFGIGINLDSLTPKQREEGMKFAGINVLDIKKLNQSLAKGMMPEIKVSLEQAINFAEWHRQKISGPAAERYFGKEFLNNLPPMRKAAIEYVFFHYGEGTALKMKSLLKHLKEENFVEINGHATSSRQIDYKGKEILFPNSRTGLILDLAFKDKGNGEFFFFSAVGADGENLRKLDKTSSDYDNLAKQQIAKLYNENRLKYSGNNLIKISNHTDEYVAKLNDKTLINYLASQNAIKNLKNKGDFLTEEDIMQEINESFKKAAEEKGIKVNLDNNFAKNTNSNSIEENVYLSAFNKINENNTQNAEEFKNISTVLKI